MANMTKKTPSLSKDVQAAYDACVSTSATCPRPASIGGTSLGLPGSGTNTSATS
jgi:hypothetical protein